MTHIELEELIKLLEDDFNGDYNITRTELLGLLKKSKWNARIRVKDEIEKEKKELIMSEIEHELQSSNEK